jgi:hypothetical protein
LLRATAAQKLEAKEQQKTVAKNEQSKMAVKAVAQRETIVQTTTRQMTSPGAPTPETRSLEASCSGSRSHDRSRSSTFMLVYILDQQTNKRRRHVEQKSAEYPRIAHPILVDPPSKYS